MWSHSRFPVIAAIFLAASLQAACGFHLRGAGDRVPWPSALSPVSIQGPEGTDDVRAELAHRLRENYSITVADDKNAPVLKLLVERFERRPLALTLTGKASEYLLRLRVEAQVQDSAGKLVVPKMAVILQRNFSYDSSQVLAMEAEQQRLRQDMIRDAARQLLARIAAQYPRGAS